MLDETQVFPMIDERGEGSTWVICMRSAMLCHLLDHIDSWDKLIRSVIKLFLIIIILIFKPISSYLPAIFLAS